MHVTVATGYNESSSGSGTIYHSMMMAQNQFHDDRPWPTEVINEILLRDIHQQPGQIPET